MINVTKSDLPDLEKYVEYLKRIWSSNWLTNDGELVQLLRAQLEDRLRVRNLVLVVNGTLALHLALRALQLKGEVITTPFTFSTTTNVILWEGLTPVFADIDPETFNIDPEAVESRVTERTSAILATHVYGNPCDVQGLQRIADAHNLKIIYDAAHAFGVEYKGQSILNYGDLSTLSFHATKVFNTAEGGAVAARSEEWFQKLRLLINHGIRSEEEVVLPGTNAKMNELQAAMGLCNLENIEQKIQLRKGIYERYKEELARIGDLKFQRVVASKYNYIYMPVCFKNAEQRDQIYLELTSNGIKPRKYFFPLTVEFDYFRADGIDYVRKYGLNVASDIAGRVLCLPLYPDLDAAAVGNIIGIIKRKLAKSGAPKSQP